MGHLRAAETRDNRGVPYIPNGYVNEARLAAAVQRAARALSADVVHIYYDLGSDWIGNPSIFFKIVLTDRASKPQNLRNVAQKVALKIMNEAKTDQSGVHAYFNFRSKSEQAQIRDPAWA
jgi:hypothetical protein